LLNIHTIRMGRERRKVGRLIKGNGPAAEMATVMAGETIKNASGGGKGVQSESSKSRINRTNSFEVSGGEKLWLSGGKRDLRDVLPQNPSLILRKRISKG